MNWVVPYIDQPISFWQSLTPLVGRDGLIAYFPLPDSPIGTGRPRQPNQHLQEFLSFTSLSKAVLLNPVALPQPVEMLLPDLSDRLKRLWEEHGIQEAVLADALLAVRLRETLPQYRFTASTLLDIVTPAQVAMLQGAFDCVIPGRRAVRDLRALRLLREAFPGRIRLLVNEGCLPGCPYRVQHFFEMNSCIPLPGSLCAGLLAKQPWLALTGAWILPHHLKMFAGLYDEVKFAGRVTLQSPEKYRGVLSAYVNGSPLAPYEVGGGPALAGVCGAVSEEFFTRTLNCEKDCGQCNDCSDYYEKHIRGQENVNHMEVTHEEWRSER